MNRTDPPISALPAKDGEDGIEENHNLIKLYRLEENIRHQRDLGAAGRAYLQEALVRALAGDSDPFLLKRPKGRQPRPQLHLAIAETVARLHWDEGLPLHQATEQAGALVAESLRQWSRRVGRSRDINIEVGPDTALKAFQKYRASMEAGRLIYGARNVQRDMTPEESERLSCLLAEDLRRRGFGTAGK